MIIILDKTFVPGINRHIEEDLDDGSNSDYDGYYCLRLEPSICECGYLKEYFEPYLFHVILVFEKQDDVVLLKTAAVAKDKLGLDARIVEYKPDFGKAIDFYEAVKCGLLWC